MKMKTTAVMLLAMTATMPALADNHAAVKGEAQVEAETGFFSRAMGGIRNIFGGDEAAKENQGKSEAAHENAAESKAEGQAKAEAARDKTKDNMKAAKDKTAKDKSKMKDKAAVAEAKAAEKAEDGKANAAEQAETKADKADEAAAKNEPAKGKGLGVDAKLGVKLGE